MSHAASTDTNIQGIIDASAGLIQLTIDNFDADISSPNGKMSTHALATIAFQPTSSKEHEKENEILVRRISKEEMSKNLPDAEDLLLDVSYHCSKKPPMIELPDQEVSQQMKLYQQNSNSRAEDYDMQFLQEVISSDNCPEYNGFNTILCREQGHSLQPKTNVVYIPLQDTSPNRPKNYLEFYPESQRYYN